MIDRNGRVAGILWGIGAAAFGLGTLAHIESHRPDADSWSLELEKAGQVYTLDSGMTLGDCFEALTEAQRGREPGTLYGCTREK